MSAPATTPALAPVPATARMLAAQLAGLFTADQQIVVRLNDAHHRLAAANDRLWTDLPVPDPIRVHHEVHSAFCAYQHAAEERRRLADGTWQPDTATETKR